MNNLDAEPRGILPLIVLIFTNKIHSCKFVKFVSQNNVVTQKQSFEEFF